MDQLNGGPNSQPPFHNVLIKGTDVNGHLVPQRQILQIHRGDAVCMEFGWAHRNINRMTPIPRN